ncbi:type III-A CRISPR-associated RAMP protein Csm5 [Thermodesulfatator autotrophicus]|uniref:CRISPR system Cms protein Csm5 n=1 Tax=Thermodesulfatator autotrophicus TaxID=1795632 RepID=A0A177E416_9BACT|nr:type III-A CRISPR-associated RAMP protein Csm5 [Thermodesulfatator autotrophicus]OAG26707.1 hypothetical protein TH606_10885 [Thermodesulfatator autotrophicus]
MRNFLDAKILAFQLLSPLHVGSHIEKYTPFEYFIHKEEIYFINENKLFSFLKERNLLSKYISEINIHGPKFNIFNFLKENLRDINAQLLKNISRYKAKIETDKNFLEIRPLIRDGMGVPYIPASTIKGLIRTAVLYKVLKSLKERAPQQFKTEILEKIKNFSKKDIKKREPFKWLINKWLQDFQIENKKNSPHTDWLRLIRVRDAYPVFSCTTRIYEIAVLSYNGSRWLEKENISIFLECIPPGSIYQFEISMDTMLIEKFKVSPKLKRVEDAYPRKIEEIFKALEEFSNDLCEEEQKVFTSCPSLKQWYKQTRSKESFCLGWGGGLLSKTIFLLLPEEVRKFIRNNLRHDRGEALAPKSRHIAKLKQKILPLGWAKWVHNGETIIKTSGYKIILNFQGDKFKLIKK